jgi:hypothetical protein
LFYLGNPSWISYTVSVAIEIGAVASFLTLSILSRLNKTIVWLMFFILFFMQVVGNVYFSYDWVTAKIAQDPSWLTNFREMMEFFVYKVDEKTSKMILSLLIGVPIPLISVFLLKSTSDYLGDDSEETSEDLEKERVEEIKDSTDSKEEVKDEKIESDPEIDNKGQSRNRIHPSRA